MQCMWLLLLVLYEIAPRLLAASAAFLNIAALRPSGSSVVPTSDDEKHTSVKEAVVRFCWVRGWLALRPRIFADRIRSWQFIN